MVGINDNMNCCGLRELDGLSSNSNPIDAMLQVAREMYGEIVPKTTMVNPFKKPKGMKWTEDPTVFSERYWTRDNGEKVYEYMSEDWEYDHGKYADRYYGDDGDCTWRYAVFTQAGAGKTYGRNFAALIRKEQLGEVVQATTKTVKNPNSGNILKAWLWTVNHKALKAWVQKQVNLQAKGTK